MTSMEPRPSPAHVRAIFFPEHDSAPELVWIKSMPENDWPSDPGTVEVSMKRRLLMRNDEDWLGVTKVNWNNRLRRPSSRIIEFIYRDNFYNDGSVSTASMRAAVEPHGEERRNWKGPVLVCAISINNPSDETSITEDTKLGYTDATLEDFRSVIDYALCYVRL
ncbi:hypothetical protein GGR52DRAFT_576021 [Hypoxylon sp. FL1284]|nr:hypothetical protein GGR52DRAFT_576021 [Hypoxylon sp. FL1284]